MTDSTDAGASWKSAGEKLSDLGATLKGHYARQRADDAPTKDDVSAAMGKLAGVLQDAADAARQAAKDPSVKSDLKDVGRTLGAALGATAEQVATELKRAFDQRQGQQPAGDDRAGSPGEVWHEAADSPAADTPAAPGAPTPPQDGPGPRPAPPASPAPPSTSQIPPGDADPSI